jgi:hypothetical protein
MKILLGDFKTRVERENIFKPINGNGNLSKDSNDNVFRILNFATSKNLVVKNKMFPHCTCRDKFSEFSYHYYMGPYLLMPSI